MNIYISNDFDGEPTGVLLADSQEKAEIAWAAMGTPPHTVEVIDPQTARGVYGLVILLTSESKALGGRETVRIWKRGN